MSSGYPWLDRANDYNSYATSARSFRALIRRFETQNSILAGTEIFHSIVRDKNAPIASTLGTLITFNSELLPTPDTQADIMFLTGVNNHELGHVMFSPTDFDIRSMFPGADNRMYNRLSHDRLYGAVMNLMEDQREEMLMCKRFANQRPYFISSFTRMFLNNPATYDTAYLYARGRRYLPVKIRRRLKKKFKVQAIIPDIRRIIDGYCKLNLFTSDGLWKAHQYVEEMVKLLTDNDLIPKNEDGESDPGQLDSCGHVHDAVHNSPYNDQESHADKQDEDEVQQAVAAVAAHIDAEAGQGDGQATGAQGSDSEHDDQTGDGAQSGKGKDAEDAPDAPEGPEGGSGAGTGDGNSAGKGAGTEEPPTDQEVEQELTALVNEQQDDQAVQEDVRQAELYIRVSREVAAPRLRERDRVTPEMPGIARRLATALRVEEAEADPYWLSGQTSGRLDVQAVMRGADREYVFNRWMDGGYGGNDQEWVVLLDCSGSMDSFLRMLSQANWVMKKAADIVEAKMTTISFGSSGQLVYGAEDRASTGEMPLMVDLGGTDPAAMLLEAHKLLTTSKRRQRGLLILTDGAWSGGRPGPFMSNEALIADLNEKEVLTHLVYFGGRSYQSHGCRTHGGIGELSELPKIFKDLVKSRMTKAH